MICDTHAHYDDIAFDKDREILLKDLPQNNVKSVINVGCDINSSIESLKISEKFSYIYNAVGIHPYFANENLDKNYLNLLRKMLEDKKNIAIGEIGLDYVKRDKIEIQKQIFKEQIELAVEKKLPILVHARDSFDSLLEILGTYKYKIKGILHCFTGNLRDAQKLFELNFKIGTGGIITFRNAENLREAIKNIPVSEIMLETDAPYLAPTPFRGRRCDSSMIKHTVEKISEIKNLDSDEIYNITEKNFFDFFEINN
ncbi:MAG: TatD family hydrolase [Candidatus Improbicoccus pseudotrichonymphae]|uniref:TatD family hydrolase n=1 Tax=Candidatus Improbicoccus pseudotrichonymphae TaxID=3033792 RepID=A0AA48I8L2_9FIRM|nr:MAG: TatD family hydrolase [Candidatus Improbicoccus pseudotrichonymphae]